jgi:hypothetical protein
MSIINSAEQRNTAESPGQDGSRLSSFGAPLDWAVR